MPLPRPSSRAVTAPARAWLELARPANVATALADVLAGASVAGFTVGRAAPATDLWWLLGATACLYAGGVVLNDVFDRVVDARERPERPIPSGRVRAAHAAVAAGGLLAAGIAAAAVASPAAAVVAGAVCAAVVSYDAWAKRHAFLGPANMGLCRALNLMLGVSLVPEALAWAWPLSVVPLTYIAAVTMVSRGEVHGARQPVLRSGLGLLAGVVAALAIVAATGGPGSARALPPTDRGWALLLVGWLAWRILPVFWQALLVPEPGPIRRAVRTGVLALVLVDAVIAASYAGIMNSLAVLATGLLAWWLARLFAVT